MQRNQIEQIKELVEAACKRRTNYFGYRAWGEHIVPMIYYAKLLARKLKADVEIVELAAILHDYASVSKKEWYPNHHLIGAQLAEKVLRAYNYPTKRIILVQHCTIAHRASKRIKAETVEARIIADADSMAHFNDVGSLMYLAFMQHRLSTVQGTRFVLNKLTRSWKRLHPAAREVLDGKFKAIKKALSVGI